MKCLKKLVVAAAVVAAGLGAFANEHTHRDRAHHDDDSGSSSRIWLPIGLSIIAPPVQLPSPMHSVFGAMVNLGYGQMTDVAILDVGLINNVTDDMVGLEVGAVNLAGTCLGVQAGVVNYASTVCGVQVGLVNIAGSLHGLQLGVLNFSSSGGALVFPIFNLGF